MKLINFLLDVVEEYDGELFHDNLDESKFSFCWNNKTLFTLEGLYKFKNVLDSEVKLLKNGNIQLLSQTLTQEEYDLFLAACAEYVACTDYDLWFKEEKK